MSVFITFNADKNKLVIEATVPKDLRIGYTRGGRVDHLHFETAISAVCGRARCEDLRDSSKIAGTSYLWLCPYCLAWVQRDRGTREHEVTK